MQDSPVSSVRTTLTGLSCEVRTGEHLPVLHPDEACCLDVPCDNPGGENIITCKDSRRQNFLNEVGGLALDIVIMSDIGQLPAYIPIYDYRSLDQAFLCDSPVVGITLKEILLTGFTQQAGVYKEQAISFRGAEIFADLAAKKRVILFLTGPDTLIEWVWYNRDDCGFYAQLQQMRFWAVTGFNFSVFAGECPFAQALNQKRSLCSSALLEKNNIQSIPHIYAVTDAHINRFDQWLKENPAVKAFVINAQMQKSDEDINQLIHTVRTLLDRHPNLHVILQGFHFSNIERFGALLPRIHFADSKAVKYGHNHLAIGMDQTTGEFYETTTQEDFKTLVQHNVRFREKQLDNILRSTARKINLITKKQQNAT